MLEKIINSFIKYAKNDKGGSLSSLSSLRSFWSVSAPLGLVSSFFTSLRNAAFDCGLLAQIEPPLPVVSVGNITLGGTNKTPTVEYLSQYLHDCGLKVGILSRGYSGSSDGPRMVDALDAHSQRNLVGDEPLMLAKKLPHIPVMVCKDRLSGVDKMKELGIEIVVADDAFQHRRLKRDVDVVLIDALCPFGNGRLLPAGILREAKSTISRADIVLLTKSDIVSQTARDIVTKEILKHIPADRLFFSSLKLKGWKILGEDGFFDNFVGSKAVAFSAVGNPDSFHRLIENASLCLCDTAVFRDHHRYTAADMRALFAHAQKLGAQYLVCTEKDLCNLPEDFGDADFIKNLPLKILIPIIAIDINEPARFFEKFAQLLRPNFIIASNGYGEDAIAARLAQKVKAAFPCARTCAFALVGKGKAYEGVEVLSPPCELPSGGVIKYSLKSLLIDLRHGLPRDIASQIGAWGKLRRFRTPLCVGDVYLLLNTLIGQGAAPLLAATAKTVYLSGHWRIERFILRHRCRMVWTRDYPTKEQLSAARVNAVYEGSPIMDLVKMPPKNAISPWRSDEKRHILALAGSRNQAYEDIKLLKSAMEKLSAKGPMEFVMITAPTLDRGRLEEIFSRNGDLTKIDIAFHDDLTAAALGADVLLGLGGTANQLCAGLGVPVISIDDKGKRVQKKLLQDAEILTARCADALCDAVWRVLSDEAAHKKMSEAGKKMLGQSGALDGIVRYAAENLGWEARCKAYEAVRQKINQRHDYIQ